MWAKGNASTESTTPFDDTENDTSPESAALARGAAASAKHGVRATASRSAVGRLPVTSPTAAKLPKPSLPRSLPRARGAVKPTTAARAGNVSRIKVKGSPRANQTIAKATDRFSTGIDVWNAASSEDTLSDGRQRKSLSSRLPSFAQIAAFTRTFVTNTVMGMAVFATYEGIVENFSADGKKIQRDERDKHNTTEASCQEQTNLSENVSMPLHFLAGGMGGMSHALLSLALETKLCISNCSIVATNMQSTLIPIPRSFASLSKSSQHLSLQYPNVRYSIATVAHHSIAHSMLFGSYQCTKSFLSNHFIFNSQLSNDTTTINSLNEDEDKSFFEDVNKEAIIHASIIAFAGGIAGQCQYLVSHFTEQWFGLVTTAVEEPKQVKEGTASFRRGLMLPACRSTFMAFPPSALGFLAYEYGKMMV
jgi:hypothetical protein